MGSLQPAIAATDALGAQHQTQLAVAANGKLQVMGLHVRLAAHSSCTAGKCIHCKDLVNAFAPWLGNAVSSCVPFGNMQIAVTCTAFGRSKQQCSDFVMYACMSCMYHVVGVSDDLLQSCYLG